MESPATRAASATAGVPGVVAAVVTAGPSDDLLATLGSLAAQDYPALRVAVLVIGDRADADAVDALARAVVPDVVVRGVGGDIGRAAAADQILELVSGESGLFLLASDALVLATDAVGRLVEEMFRSNAGVVGPKLLDWDEPSVISSVGDAVDRFGRADDGLEPHEIDQEQHDAVRDVFSLSSSCLLVRADLFRRLGGFEPGLDRPIDALDLCWRAHLSGARVVVAPAATARHRPVTDGAGAARVERQRVTTVASLSGGQRLVTLVPALIVATVAAAIVAVFRGDASGARRRLSSLAGLLALPEILRRRSKARDVRVVPDREVVALQMRGSAEVAKWLRGREVATRRVRAETGRPATTVVVTAVLVVLLFVGARGILTGGIRPVGEMFDLPSSPLDSLRSYLTGWWGRGFGETTAQPTGLLVVALTGLVFLARMSALASWGVVALVAIGWWGAVRLGDVGGSRRARLAALVVYAAAPLPYAAIGAGRTSTLVAYALVPWVLHHGRVVAGLSLGAAGRSDADVDDAEDGLDLVDHPTTPTRVAALGRLVAVVAVAMAFAPAAALIGVLALVVSSSTGWIAGGSRRSAGLGIAAAVVASTGAVVLNLPWSLRFLDADAWAAVTGVRSASGELGWWDVLRFGVGPTSLASTFLLAYVPTLVALVVARSWRGVWAARGATLVAVFVFLAVAATTGRSPFDLPEVGVLLAPVGAGLALGAATMVASFESDVRGARFGLRQPASIAAIAAIAVLVVPTAAVAVDGSWKQPSTSLVDQMSELFADPNGSADFRVLVVGDPDLVPGADSPHTDGVAYDVFTNGAATIEESWKSPSTTEQRIVDGALDALAEQRTARVGRLLGPLGVRYVVVPLVDRVRSTSDDPRPVAAGLLESLGRQLDLRMRYSPASMVVYENMQWIPIRSVLSESAAAGSTEGGAGSLVATELSGSTPVFPDSTAWNAAEATVPAGVVHLAVPFDARWRLSVDGRRQPAVGSFGATMSFATPGGEAELSYDSSLVRFGWVVLQITTWAVVAIAVLQPRRRRRGRPLAATAPALAFDEIAEAHR